MASCLTPSGWTMSDAGLLNVVLYLPLARIGATTALPGKTAGLVRGPPLAAMLLQFAITAVLYLKFDAATAELQFETRLPWIAPWGVYYQIGLDGYNVLLVLLTAFL